MTRSVLIVAFAFSLSAHAADAPELLPVGTKAPNFTLRTINKEASGIRRASLSRLVGPRAKEKGVKLVAVSFYATWCASCQNEVPLLDKWATQLKDQGFRAFVIGTDKGSEGKKKLTARVAELGLSLPVFHDGLNVLMRRYKAAALPTFYLIGADGKIVYAKSGFSEKKGDAQKMLEAIRANL